MRKITAFVCFSLALSGFGFAAPRTLLVRVEAPPCPWRDSRLYDKLETRFTRDQAFRVIPANDCDDARPPFPRARNNVDSLIAWAQEAGGRYLLLVRVDGERIARRKTFNFPLFFHKYQTEGLIEGELRLLDVSRGRVLAAEPFSAKLSGPRVFQGSMDDDINDPDILLTAVQKLRFFDRLEDLAASKLAERCFELMGRR
jgi:hypothetical protein